MVVHPAWGVAEVSAQVGLSACWLEHVFEEKTGETLFNVILARRLLRAVDRLLHSPDAITSIAADLGYRRPENFTRSFRNHLGVPPGWIRGHATAVREVMAATG